MMAAATVVLTSSVPRVCIGPRVAALACATAKGGRTRSHSQNPVFTASMHPMANAPRTRPFASSANVR